MRIELKNVAYAYGSGKPALQDIDLTIGSREMIAVIGHSGSGKSTLSLLLAGLYSPTAGEITTVDLPRRSKDGPFSGVGLVFQYPEDQLFADSVYDEIAFGAKNMGTPQDYLPHKVRLALDAVGLDADKYWHHSPFLLSGGQKRRVCIASVLAMEPNVLILDEPAAGLDEEGRQWMMDLVRNLHEKGRTVIWVTHDMAEAAELAERIIVLDHGRILLDGSPHTVFREEKILQEAGLDIPLAAAVVRRLREAGIPVAAEAVTPTEAASEIAGWLDHRHDPPARPEPEAESAENGEPELDVAAILGGEADV